MGSGLRWARGRKGQPSVCRSSPCSEGWGPQGAQGHTVPALDKRTCCQGWGAGGSPSVRPSLQHLQLRPLSGQTSAPPAPIRRAAASWAGADPLLASALLGGANAHGAGPGRACPRRPPQPVQVLLGLHASMLETLAICCWGWERRD